MDPATLVEQIRQGNVEALGQWIELRRPQLMAFIERKLGPGLRRKVEPDDILQEMSAEAVRSLPTAPLTDRDPFNWLCQVAERRIIDAHRRFFEAKKRDAARERGIGPRGDDSGGGLIELLVASMTTPSEAFSRNAREARLADAMRSLGDEQQRVLRLRYVEGLPSKEIAERIGKSDAAVRVMLTRCVQRLRALLEAEDDHAG